MNDQKAGLCIEHIRIGFDFHDEKILHAIMTSLKGGNGSLEASELRKNIF